MAKLMLVEDDNNLREIYEARLQAEGYEIVTARDGEEALVVAKAEKPDLVISDVMMPKISGFEMLDILRNTEGMKDVKVIMLTALGQTDDQQRADKLGADRYLVKSQVTLEDIVKVTHELLEGDQGAAAAPAAPADPDPPSPADPPAPAPADPAPAAEPPAATDAAKPADSSQQSLAQEEASVEAKIESFVAGAAPAPPAPAAPAPADPAPVTPESTTPETPPPAGSNPGPAATNDPAVADDKLVTDAVKALATNGSDDAAKPAEDAGQQPAPAEPPEPKAEPKAEDEAKEKADEPGSVPIAHKKVIQPIEGETKKDINQLLAEEEAKTGEADQPKAAEPKVVAVDVSEEKKDKVDPNSIAL
jgi:CheY-like chemotaxis protein